MHLHRRHARALQHHAACAPTRGGGECRCDRQLQPQRGAAQRTGLEEAALDSAHELARADAQVEHLARQHLARDALATAAVEADARGEELGAHHARVREVTLLQHPCARRAGTQPARRHVLAAERTHAWPRSKAHGSSGNDAAGGERTLVDELAHLLAGDVPLLLAPRHARALDHGHARAGQPAPHQRQRCKDAQRAAAHHHVELRPRRRRRCAGRRVILVRVATSATPTAPVGARAIGCGSERLVAEVGNEARGRLLRPPRTLLAQRPPGSLCTLQRRPCRARARAAAYDTRNSTPVGAIAATRSAGTPTTSMLPGR
eukprot:scaffold1277_cov329-Prasinococcus_capsulatus_cf.AAC.12